MGTRIPRIVTFFVEIYFKLEIPKVRRAYPRKYKDEDKSKIRRFYFLNKKKVQHYISLIFEIWITTNALISQVLEASQRKVGV